MTVVHGVDPSFARRVAELFYIPFGEKLAGLALPRDREKAIVFLSRTFRPEEVYAAIDSEGCVVGVAFVTGAGRLLDVKRDAVLDAFGTLSGWVRWTVYSVLARITRGKDRPKETRGLEGFSVDPACRGKGIGAAMIERIASDAAAQGARAIELNVGENNPARHLYERSGFEVTRTATTGVFARRLGFKRFVYYERKLRG